MSVYWRNILAGIALLTVFVAPSAWAGDGHTGWSATLYGGPYTTNITSDIFTHGAFNVRGGMVGLAVERRLFNLGWDISFGAEAQITHYFGDDNYSTGAFGIGFRFDRFPWDNTSFAIYSGPSYSPSPPLIGRYLHREVKLLNYIGLEFAVAIPHHERHWDAVPRVYHRSGVWGVYSDNVDEGSMIGVGIRARF